MNSTAKRLGGFLALLLLGACITGGGKTPQARRAAVLKMRAKVLADLYKAKPRAKAEISGAPGYGVFSNASVNVLLASFGGGYGVVEEKKTGKKTFMRMGEAGLGLGLGAKDYRVVFIFDNRAALERFLSSGWGVGGHADAAAKAGDKGAAVGGEALIDGITIYQLTESGLALQATVKGTKYWPDDELNKR